MVLPLLVDHVERDEREQAIGEALSTLVRDRVQAVELLIERGTPSLEGNCLRLLNRCGTRALGERRDLKHVVHQQILLHVLEVPVFLLIERRKRLLDATLHATIDHLERFALELLATFECERAQRVDHLTLLVHHIVVLVQPLTRLEVLELDPLLCLFDGARDERVRKHLAVLGAHAIHQLGDPIGPEETHEIIFERQEELRRTGITLATGTTAQLTIDTT